MVCLSDLLHVEIPELLPIIRGCQDRLSVRNLSHFGVIHQRKKDPIDIVPVPAHDGVIL